jgi:hypothetical protein
MNEEHCYSTEGWEKLMSRDINRREDVLKHIVSLATVVDQWKTCIGCRGCNRV